MKYIIKLLVLASVTFGLHNAIYSSQVIDPQLASLVRHWHATWRGANSSVSQDVKNDALRLGPVNIEAIAQFLSELIMSDLDASHFSMLRTRYGYSPGATMSGSLVD